MNELVAKLFVGIVVMIIASVLGWAIVICVRGLIT